ncbi:MAG TPA: hypothetical protein VK638_47235 [Edaphobacter sp.]|nr:hypothetical protein [Edaphobacter sp.]
MHSLASSKLIGLAVHDEKQLLKQLGDSAPWGIAPWGINVARSKGSAPSHAERRYNARSRTRLSTRKANTLRMETGNGGRTDSTSTATGDDPLRRRKGQTMD